MLKDIIEGQKVKARLYHPEHLGVEGGSCVACALIDLQYEIAQIVAREVREQCLDIVEDRCVWYNTNNQIPVEELAKGDEHYDVIKKAIKDSLGEVLQRIKTDLQSLEKDLSAYVINK